MAEPVGDTAQVAAAVAVGVGETAAGTPGRSLQSATRRSRTGSGTSALRDRSSTVGHGPVEPRTTSSGRKRYSECGAGWPPISSTRAPTAAMAMARTGWRSVVSGGSVKGIRGESSCPTTEMSRGRCGPGPYGADRAERHEVGAADQAGDASVEEPVGCGVAALNPERGELHQ